MPKTSLSTFESITREAAPHLERTEVRRVAKLAKRRHDMHTSIPSHVEALATVKAIAYADTTGEDAVYRVLSERGY